jgi:FAD/FMN-containing dehydrogenase
MIADFNVRNEALAESPVQQLAARLAGELILPTDEAYEEARKIRAGNFDKFPALVVRPADVIDVIRAVNFARENDLTVAVRSGGHSFAGYSTVEGGLVIDLSSMKDISIDPERRVARVQPGLTWAEYAAEANKYGLATSSGDVGSVGVGGLIMGGGIGWMVRKHGLTIDHLISVDIVTADGRFVTASADENPDLFWAVRGGGGNFGIATSFELQLYPAGTILGGAVIYSAADGKEVLREYLRYANEAPDELSTQALMLAAAPPLPFIPEHLHGSPIILISVVYNGDLEEGERVLAPLRSLATPIADLVGPMPYPAQFELYHEATIRGRGEELRSTYLYEVKDELIDIVLERLYQATSPLNAVQWRVLGGAMARVPADATAFAHRDKPYMVTLIANWLDVPESQPHLAWLEQFWAAVQPYGAGVYVNFLGLEGEDRIREAYKPATYERLAEVKRRYDPTNFFRLNQNVKPKV